MKDQNPWLRIPVDDYESHMSEVGQSALLREFFGRVYDSARPARLAILGCTTGEDFRCLDPMVTKEAWGLDINPRYIETAQARWRDREPVLQLIAGDVLESELPAGRFDLVHAALLIEYVSDPIALFGRIQRWLSADGLCSLVTQEPSTDLPAVSDTRHGSLRALSSQMALRTSDDVASLANQAGLAEVARSTVILPSGKSFASSILKKASSAAQPGIAADERLGRFAPSAVRR